MKMKTKVGLKVGLIDVDSHNFPNLPLMKISAFHKKRGDDVGFWIPFEKYDIVYKSKIFTFTPDLEYTPMADETYEGGTGYGNNAVTLPPQTEHIMPDYTPYSQRYPKYEHTALGFLTRGCPRNCPFCIVSSKEGAQSRQVAELEEFWSGTGIRIGTGTSQPKRTRRPTIKLLDPNILACADREKLLKRLAESETGAYVDFTQGLDIRMIDRDIISQLNQIKTKCLYFAWDNPKQDLTRQSELV